MFVVLKINNVIALISAVRPYLPITALLVPFVLVPKREGRKEEERGVPRKEREKEVLPRKEGRTEGRTDGRTEGRKEGRKEGREGRKRSKRRRRRKKEKKDIKEESKHIQEGRKERINEGQISKKERRKAGKNEPFYVGAPCLTSGTGRRREGGRGRRRRSLRV